MTNFPFTKMPGVSDMDFSPSNLNKILIRRLPFLFDGLDPDSEMVDCARDLMEHYNQVKTKNSALSSLQRMMIVDYVEKCREHAKEKTDG